MFDYFWCFYCGLKESNVFLFLIALLIGALITLHIYTGRALCEPSPGSDFNGTRTRSANSCTALNQSPINIDTSCVERVHFETPLIWTNYDTLPAGMYMENNSNTLLLRAAYGDRIPSIAGGDLLERFNFREISFRWSWHSNGSEHSLNNKHFPLEMQCVHTSGLGCGDTQISSQRLLIVSYFFDISTQNPCMDVLIQHLAAVQQAGKCVEIPPFPLRYLMLAFYTGFFSYHGSVTEPPFYAGAEWFICPTPLAISERQLNEFRQLCGRTGARIEGNARPIQNLDDRIVYLNKYEAARCRK